MTGVQGTSPAGEMPEMAGEDVRLHDAVTYWEGAQSALAHKGLLKSAMGMLPDEAKKNKSSILTSPSSPCSSPTILIITDS